MKPHTWFFLLFGLLMGGVMSIGQIQANVSPETKSSLVYISIPTPDAQSQISKLDISIYAHVNGRSGPALLVGATPANLAALAASDLDYWVLENISEKAGYYLAYPLPRHSDVNWVEVGQVLLVDPDWRLIRATPEMARQLAAQGIQVQHITFDPKPLLPVTAVVDTPTVIEPDPTIQTMIDQVISDTVYLYDGNLSGEWPVNIGGSSYTIATRHTYSGEPIQKATQFVGEHLANLGLPVEYHQWSGDTYPNVIGEITGLSNPNEIYIVSAHLDDMPSSANAPGADDNASGVAATLIAADIFSQYQWDCTLRFGLWTGEEQGLNGSHAYAQRAYNNGENIAGVLNLDMIAWNTPNSSRNIDLHATSSIPATLDQAQLFVDVIEAYDLNLIPEINPNGTGASDHASFWQYGYAAILGIEDFDDFNPYYHTTNDLLAHTDMDYFTEFVRASVGTFAHLTGCLVSSGLGTMEGHITEAGSGTPIAEATVTMQSAEGNIFTALADSTGYYSRTLMASTYTVTAQAYGYLPLTIPGIVVITDTITTQDIALIVAPIYNISGTVTAMDTGLPLGSQIEFQDTPVSVTSDPITGFYQAVVAQGSYTMRVAAIGYRPEERPILVGHNQTQNFALVPLPCVLLVDDDNDDPDVQQYYTTALDSLGINYDIFNVGSGTGPSLAEMEGYQAIIWFSGDKYGSAGPNSTDEANLATYLDSGGRLFLSSQDYLYDMNLTPFGQMYLGIGSYSNDSGNALAKYGVPGDPIGDNLGPYPLNYPPGFTDYGDIVNAGNEGSLAFRSSATSGNGLDVDKEGVEWKTVFFGTAWEAVAYADVANGEELLQRILNWFDVCECQAVQIIDVVTEVNACMVNFDPDYVGTLPITWEWVFPNGNPSVSQSENPTSIDFSISGTYAYTATAINCGGAATSTWTDVVTVQCDAYVPITAVLVTVIPTSTVYAGDSVAFEVEIVPETAVPPYSYTVSINSIDVITGQTTLNNPLTFDYTFADTGVYMVTVSVWNYGMASPVSHTVNVTALPIVEERYIVYLAMLKRP